MIVVLEAGICDTLRIGNGVIPGVAVAVAVLEFVWVSEPGTVPCVALLLFPLDPEEPASQAFEPKTCPSFFLSDPTRDAKSALDWDDGDDEGDG